jgi:DNA-binding response OmpR family regulator
LRGELFDWATERRVLVVDDEEAITDSMKVGLEKEGFRVDAYNDPAEALENFRPGRYVGVVLDIRMKPLSGPELFAKMKVMDPRPRYLFFSAFEPEELGLSAEVPFLKKPISLRGLAERLTDLEVRVREKHSRDES